jgi:hypothetical protein
LGLAGTDLAIEIERRFAMSKKILLVMAVAILIVAVNTAYSADEPTQKEWQIYYSYVQQMHGFADTDSDTFVENFDSFAKAYSITPQELSAILEKVDDYGLSIDEKKIFGELQEKLIALPDDATEEQKMAVFTEIEQNYNVSEDMLYDIIRRSLASQSEL